MTSINKEYCDNVECDAVCVAKSVLDLCRDARIGRKAVKAVCAVFILALRGGD